ncbi:oxidoreductase [Microvirga sp. 2TAF3]|uniref:oxidoreductase n=1 Tax=Microvirga sp. 2TAF3 TaxID=3233014 RepID=UPI003F94815E
MHKIAWLLSLVATLAFGVPAWAAEPLPAPKGPVLLTISGAIEATNAPGLARFDREMLEALGKASIKTGSVWADHPQVFEGIPLNAVLERVGAKGANLKASALNDYQVDIPFEDLKYSPLLAMSVDGKVLSIRDKGPLWIVYPRDEYTVLNDYRYDSRWVWQLNRLHVE